MTQTNASDAVSLVGPAGPLACLLVRGNTFSKCRFALICELVGRAGEGLLNECNKRACLDSWGTTECCGSSLNRVNIGQGDG